MKISLMHFIIILLFISCSNSPEDALEKVKKYYNKDDYEKVMGCYTAGTVSAMEELEKLTGQPKLKKMNIGKKFMDGASWEITKNDIGGDIASLTIKYIEHPVENMRGLDVEFRLKKENGEWKIDEEKGIRENIENIRKTGAKINTKDKFRNYRR